MKILITGFQRSGTTMTRRLLQYHPNVDKIFHEQKILNRRKTREELLIYARDLGVKDPSNSIWGDKVPFYHKSSSRQIKYINRWNGAWGKQARTIYLIRHPVDIAISTVRVHMGKSIKDAISRQNSSVPKVVEELKTMNNVLIVSFESLVTNHKDVLKRIFKFCDLSSSDEILDMVCSAKKKQLRYFDSINADRAFAYKKQTDLKIDIDYYDYDKIRRLGYVI